MITYQDIKSGAASFTSADQFKGRHSEDVKDWDLEPTDIKLDQSAQPRESLNNDRIAEYAEAMKAGDQFPPLTVFHDGSTYWLADGFHRHYAAQHAGRKHIRCYVRQGGLRDAILYSVGANAKHGLARSDEDKKRAVMRLLDDPEWSLWSDREIARRCHVSDKTVAKYRPAVSADDPQIERKVQRGGTVYTQKVLNKRATAAPAYQEGGGEKQEITSQTVVQKGDEGGALPETPVEEITPRNIRDELVALWSEASAEDRSGFIAHLRVLGYRIEVNAGGGDVDRSAMRASSAVEVGATNSPDGADETGRFESGSLTEILVKPQVRVLPGTPIQGAKGGPTGMGWSDGVERHAPNSNPQPNTPSEAEKAEAETPPTVSAAPFNNPRCQNPETCHLAHTRNECFDCNLAWSKRPKDEQVRLWAEAVQAARAA
ncbi:ParB/RepB/Spo0J family partition protein [Mesorhizobium sp. Pch-S]|uniref:ParB/RepB/Spo0J family partition protein n=1 Tax=Mesorhizobium sp. Pch-S TaxID=2082387 RepID=UPI0010115142|nr:ParB/RepB/Spo0J family partition protein [Mesorhizobium sp. Pch-S]QAZ45924.1 hypothetical protein C1M53_26425 [Mesorhizobium sp. Pch-S]